MVGSHIAFISAGSNMGRRLANCQKGFDELTRSDTTRLCRRSPFYKTEPVGFTDQDWFVNGVIEVETVLDPYSLLAELQSIQKKAGRVRDTVRFGPRVLDLDILLYDGLVLESESLTLPHPRMHKRRFVLKPICDIDPNIVHPVLKKTMSELLNGLDETGQEVIEYPCD